MITPQRILALTIMLTASTAAGAQSSRREFFESRIRPVLAERCYRCHNSTGTRKAGLALDQRAALRAGGRSGASIVIGKGHQSLLIRAMRHEDDDLRMPAEGPKLPDAVIADFAKWIDDGAFDPRDHPPSAEDLAKAQSWDEVRRRRMQWWSFQPIRDPKLPTVEKKGWSDHPADRFILSRLERAGLRPNPRADRFTLIRRLTFALTGLPPEPDAVLAFAADQSPDAYIKLVNRLLASKSFGERWARHWMDWVRYADSHGSEGDPMIPNTWRYRDYLIRAFNTDVPFDRLVREQIAGDLLPKPRINAQMGINESAIGPAQLRMVQHGFAPTDPLEEQVRFTDNQIDVLSKAFLGLTVSCARCHNHKFDALAQSDFYALYGILTSSRPAMRAVDTAERLATNKPQLAEQKTRIKAQLADAWLNAVDQLPAELLADRTKPIKKGSAAKKKRDRGPRDRNPLHALEQLRTVRTEEFQEHWGKLVTAFEASRDRLREQRTRASGWNLTGDDGHEWFRHGAGLNDEPAKPGAFHVLPVGDRIVNAILPAGVYSHLLSSKHNAVLISPEFPFDMKRIYVRVMGSNDARARYSMYGYPRRGTVYPAHILRGGGLRWVSWDVSYWKGDAGYLELTTAADQPTEANTGTTRSWFGITQAVFASTEQVKSGDVPKDEMAEFVAPLFDAAATNAPKSVKELAALYGTALRECIRTWTTTTMTDQQAHFLSFFVQNKLLPTTIDELPDLAVSIVEYRRLEAEVPVPTRVPGVIDTEPHDQPLFVRGNHRQPGEPVRQRFLEAIDSTPYRSEENGRLKLANDFVRPDNPFTPRVAVNRLWHHLFGRGLVATTDNFGRLGDAPTHPDLLDHLATRFVNSGWSIKQMIRFLVTSETFQTDSRPRRDAARIDASNQMLSHFRMRRLEAEAIRDSLLAVAGRLDRTMYGKTVNGKTPRRSVYVRVKRNDLDPFLTTFDAPAPSTTRGRRAATNVPAQSLTLLNDPFVIDQARNWSIDILRRTNLKNDDQRLTRMFLSAFGRQPTAAELRQSKQFMADLDGESAQLAATIRRIDSASAAVRQQLAALAEPIRKHLLARLELDATDAPPGPMPIANWEFDGDLEDSVGTMHGKFEGDAHLVNGTLVLGGKGHVETAPIAKALREKTLEAWVQLRNLGQRAGGVITLQSIGGGTFDSIVFAEKNERHWLPGSNNFTRTKSLRGPLETEVNQRPVHIAITYARDGTIRAYRDGEPHGVPYKSSGPMTFAAGKSVVLFGLRHSPGTSGRYLLGSIHRARLYDRALTPDEIAASARSNRKFVSDAKVHAAMTVAQRNEHRRLQARLAELQAERDGLEVPAGFRSGPGKPWQDLAQCLFNLKEFIYIR